MENVQEQKNRPLQLWWFDTETKKNMSAGVAFYDEKFGEYRLKIDVYPETQYYAKAISLQSDLALYRMEVVIKKDGKFYQRKTVGEGHSSPNTNGDIFFDFGPHKKLLVMGMKNN